MRFKNLINSYQNLSAKVLSYFMYPIIPIGFICNIIAYFFIIYDLINAKPNSKYIKTDNSIVTTANWFSVSLGINFISFFRILSLIFWRVENKLIGIKSDGPYAKYMDLVNQINNGQNNVQIVQNNNGYILNQQQIPHYPYILVDHTRFCSAEELNKNRNNYVVSIK